MTTPRNYRGAKSSRKKNERERIMEQARTRAAATLHSLSEADLLTRLGALEACADEFRNFLDTTLTKRQKSVLFTRFPGAQALESIPDGFCRNPRVEKAA